MADTRPTEQQRNDFLALIADGVKRDKAAEQVGSTGTRFRRLEKADPLFKAAYDDAVAEQEDALDDKIDAEYHDRAFDRKDPKSAMLLGRLAEARLPVFASLRTRTQVHSGQVVHGHLHGHLDLSRFSDQQLDTFEELLQLAGVEMPPSAVKG